MRVFYGTLKEIISSYHHNRSGRSQRIPGIDAYLANLNLATAALMSCLGEVQIAVMIQKVVRSILTVQLVNMLLLRVRQH